MNEIVGTLYYVLANDVNAEWAQHAEADTYFLFNLLMMEMRDVFVPDLDSHVTGLQGRISNMQTLLATHDPDVQRHLQELGIDASFYAVRWLTTLLSREFLLPDTIRLWDSMFASTHKENFLRYVCGTMVLLVREDLLKGDFSSNLRLLQRYPPCNVDHLLESSRALWIYESQITLACHKGGISLHQALHTIHPPPTILMAFGLRGGVAPTLTDSLEQAATLAVQTAKDSLGRGEGILGMRRKARGLWNKWKEEVPIPQEIPVVTTTAETAIIPEPAPAAEPTTLATEAVTASRRVAWGNRGSSSRSMNGSNDAPAVSSPPPTSRIWNRDGSNGSGSNGSANKSNGSAGSANKTTVAVNAAEAPALPSLRSRLWNRGGLSSETVPVTTTEPMISRLWNHRSTDNNSEHSGSGDIIEAPRDLDSEPHQPQHPEEQAPDMMELTTAVDKASIRDRNDDDGDTNAASNLFQRSSLKDLQDILLE
jgi:hypothetical protein